MKFYYAVMDWLTSGWLAKRLGHLYGMRPARLEAYRVPTAPLHEGSSPIWFHGASVGELEMIGPILDRALALGIPCSVSAFSDSALPWLQKLREHPHANSLRYVGLSPRERGWRTLWERLQVKSLWIAKYDFWPGMWAAASELGVEINIVNARYRNSWARLRGLMGKLKVPVPTLRFFCSSEKQMAALRTHFPEAQVIPALDPRRVRIRIRAKSPNPAAEAVKKKIETLPRPIGIVGSAWASDLEQIAHLTSHTLRGSVVVFPHSFEQKHLDELRFRLTEIARAHPVQTLLVEQKGILLESYAVADWVWVGGGFGAGIHSTLEPAFYGLPLIAGPKNAEKFDEIEELTQAKQLTLCGTREEIVQWFKNLEATPQPQIHGVSFATPDEFESWADPLLAPTGKPR